jgi:hypothetical protein
MANISKNMLCTTATAYKITSTDEDRNPVYSDGVTLTNIYTVFYTADSNGSNGKTPASAATLYYDVENSSPLGYEFEKGQRVTINGENYTVNKIAPYYNVDGLQHVEVELV